MDLIEKYSLSNLFYKNTTITQEKILFELKRLPSNVKDGYVYCFRPKNFINIQTNLKLVEHIER